MRLKDKKIVLYYIYLTSNITNFREKLEEQTKIANGKTFKTIDPVYDYVSEQYYKICKGAFKIGDKVKAISYNEYMGKGIILEINNCKTGALIKFDNTEQWLEYGNFIKIVKDIYEER